MARTILVAFRVNDAERRTLRILAAKLGRTESDVLRSTLRQAAQRRGISVPATGQQADQGEKQAA